MINQNIVIRYSLHINLTSFAHLKQKKKSFEHSIDILIKFVITIKF